MNLRSNFEHKIVIHDEKIAEFKLTLTRNLNTLNTCINSENSTNKQAEALTNFLLEHALQIFGEKNPIKLIVLLLHQNGSMQIVIELNEISNWHATLTIGIDTNRINFVKKEPNIIGYEKEQNNVLC